jgi:dTDP-4-amino-4,6-dideoxygalactose transaminase
MKNSNLIRLSKSCLNNQEIKAVSEVLKKEFLGMGKQVEEFELILTNYFQRNTVCVVNGTCALHLALQACGIGNNDEVLVPSLTYIASFQAISATGAKPIACDIDSKTLLISLEDAQKKITSKTKAIMPVHYSGGVGQLDLIYKFAKTNGLRVIEDAAHAFGTEYKGKVIGSIGDIVCFSFDGIKNITSGEGGCVVSSDVNIIEYIKDARLLGVENDSNKRYLGERSWTFDVFNQGWRFHMSNIMAAIGIVQFKKLNNFIVKRRKLAKQYDSLFLGNEKIKILERDYNTVVPHIYPVLIKGLKDYKVGIQKWLLDKGIQTGFHYQPNHLLAYYKQNKLSLPTTEKIANELLTLPLHPDLKISDVKFIVDELNLAVSHFIKN